MFFVWLFFGWGATTQLCSTLYRSHYLGLVVFPDSCLLPHAQRTGQTEPGRMATWSYYRLERRLQQIRLYTGLKIACWKWPGTKSPPAGCKFTVLFCFICKITHLGYTWDRVCKRLHSGFFFLQKIHMYFRRLLKQAGIWLRLPGLPRQTLCQSHSHACLTFTQCFTIFLWKPPGTAISSH